MLRIRVFPVFRMTYLILGLLSISSIGAQAQSCSSEFLSANYRIATEKVGHKAKVEQLTLWRMGQQVAHQYNQRQLTELWFRQKNQRVSLTRLYEQFERGIEYQAGEMSHASGSDWQSKYALISENKMQSLEKVSQEQGQFGCDSIEHYNGVVGDETIRLLWLPKLKLIKRMSVEKNGVTKTWELLKNDFDNVAVSNQYNRWSSYKTTDYADVGDNESDPFLRKMINLGF